MFIAARLRQARRRRALTKVALGEMVGLTARRIAAFENEGEVPPSSTVEALADALGFPVEFFARSGGQVIDAEAVSFRSFSRLGARTRDAALEAAAIAAEVSSWIDARFELPESDLPDLREVDPTAAAAALRSMWALGEAPAPNMIHLLESHGVRVFSLTDDCKALDAVSCWVGDNPHVFLTSHKSPERARWDAAHELGHLVMHLGCPPHGRVQEDEADAFAAEFLLPQAGVLAAAPRFPSFVDIKTHKTHWEVSALALVRRYHQLGVLTDWQYKSLVIECSQAGYRRAEGDIDRESSQMLPKVLEALRSEGVSVAQIADELGLTAGDLRGLLFMPVTAIEGGAQSSGESDRPALRLVHGSG